jgi:HEAT repeat protein
MRSLLLLSLLIGLAVGDVARAEIRPDFAMESDPELQAPEPIAVYPVENVPLWLKALARPEADLQHRAAEAIAEAHRLGTPNLGQAKPTLVRNLTAEDSHPNARLAAARALIVLEAREAAEELFAVSQQHGTDLRQLVEPALAKWKHPPCRPVWLQRLQDSETRHRDLMLALEGVRVTGDRDAVPALLTIVHDQARPPGTRLAAARAAGQIQNSGLEPDAEKLLKPTSPSVEQRLCAVALLERHRGQAAETRLSALAQDDEPTVAAAALTTLNGIDPQLNLPHTEQALANPDANVRLQGIATYTALPTPDRVGRLARLLDDPHLGVRGIIRERLLTLARIDELRSPILHAASDVLAGESWRGQEQAALLLAALDHKPVAGRFVELLNASRGEVLVASAWGLRKLAVRDTLPAMLNKVHEQYELRIKTGSLTVAADAQVGHLCEALGLMKYEPADQELRRFVPKIMVLGELSRSGAIWGLGHLHAGIPDEPLARQMTERLTEPPRSPAESERVRRACAISLGRMKATSQVAAMRQYLGPQVGLDAKSLAIRWAIHELTGELLPGPKPSRYSVKANWFLQALDESP